jgi:hypothetical protein
MLRIRDERFSYPHILELGQNARRHSEAVMNAFMEKYPNIRVYQSYDNPYWKISVGISAPGERSKTLPPTSVDTLKPL